MRSLSVLLADDDPLLRESIAALLRNYDEISEVIVACDGAQAIVSVRKHPVDVVLMDVDMPVLDGVSAAAVLSREFPALPVVMFTVFGQQDSLRQALNAGAKGFITKDIPVAKIVEAIVTASEGQTVMAPRPTQMLVESYRTGNGYDNDPEFRAKIASLPERFWDIFNLLIAAASNATISKQIALTEGTVRTYITQILRITGCHSRSELAVRALRAGITSLPLKDE